MSTTAPSQVGALFQAAQEDGSLSPAGFAALNVPDIGDVIQAGLGTGAAQMQATEVTLYCLLVDDSSSIRFSGHSQLVRDCVNELFVKALAQTKQVDQIMLAVRMLNGDKYAFIPLKKALADDGKNLRPIHELVDLGLALDTKNYNPHGGTPLYDEALVCCGLLVAKMQELSQSGVPVRACLGMVTDGHDEGSKRRAKDCYPVIRDLLMSEQVIIGGMGIDDGQTDFKTIFTEMGLEEDWILTPDNTASDIRAKFGTMSQSAVRASQGGVAFSQTAAGGFGANP